MPRTFTIPGLIGASALAMTIAGNAAGSWATGGSGANVSISKYQAANVINPAGVWLEATNHTGFAAAQGGGDHYDVAAQEYFHVWTVQGSPLADFTAPENMIPAWNDPNVMYGKKVAFCFPDTGTYTIDLWIVDREGNTATASTTVTVTDADSAFPGTQTICYSDAPGETWTGAPAGCDQVTNLTTLQNKINSISNTLTRVLFKRGSTVQVADTITINAKDVSYIGAWGTGAKPILRPQKKNGRQVFMIRNMTSDVPDLCVTGLRFEGHWDAATETGFTLHPIKFINNDFIGHFLFHDLEIDGFEHLEGRPVTNAAGVTTIFANVSITNWRNYAIYMSGDENPSRYGLIGCRLTQNPDAMNGGNSYDLFNNHGPFRVVKVPSLVFACCDLFSRNGWSPLTPDKADQSCLRINTHSEPDMHVSLNRIVAEGGKSVISSDPQDGGFLTSPGNYILDQVLTIGTTRSSSSIIDMRNGGLTVRNTVVVVPNVPKYHTQKPVNAIGVSTVGKGVYSASNQTSHIAVYNTTVLDLRDTANDDGAVIQLVEDTTVYASVTKENNVIHAPNATTTQTASAPIDVATAIPGVTPRYKGVRFNHGVETGTLSAAVANGGSFTLAYPSGTDQAYWQTNAGTRHTMRLDGVMYTAEADATGRFSVTFGASDITITNESGDTWASGKGWGLRLDRPGDLPVWDTTRANPSTIALPTPQTGSPAINGADTGRTAYVDFLGNVRPGPGGTDHGGNVRPATGNDDGALLQ